MSGFVSRNAYVSSGDGWADTSMANVKQRDGNLPLCRAQRLSTCHLGSCVGIDRRGKRGACRRPR